LSCPGFDLGSLRLFIQAPSVPPTLLTRSCEVRNLPIFPLSDADLRRQLDHLVGSGKPCRSLVTKAEFLGRHSAANAAETHVVAVQRATVHRIKFVVSQFATISRRVRVHGTLLDCDAGHTAPPRITKHPTKTLDWPYLLPGLDREAAEVGESPPTA
jgi:hypothetical protein